MHRKDSTSSLNSSDISSHSQEGPIDREGGYDNDSVNHDNSDSDNDNNTYNNHNTYNYNYQRDVPVTLTSITNEAVTRLISRIHSRASSTPVNEQDLEANLPHTQHTPPVNKFDRFSNKTKIMCLTINAMSGYLSPLATLTVLPAIPEIAERFNTTTETINISNAVYCIFMSISPCIFSPCSDIYGRRITFLVCCTLFVISCVLLGVATHIVMYFVFRSTTALFGASFFSIGGHVVGDVYHPTQRGRAISITVLGAQIGTGFGPVLGGVIVTYTGWRVIFFVLAGIGAVTLAMGFFFLPETSIETKHSIVLKEARKYNPKKKFVFIPFNPLKIVLSLRFPNLSIVGYISCALVYTMFSLLTPIRSVVNPRFDLTTPVYAGLFYLAPGMGYLVGSFIGGPLADYTVKKYIKIKGTRIPEDRLWAILIALGIIYPGSMIIYGWSIDQEVGGMAVPIIFMFTGGVSQTIIFPATNTYSVESVPELGGDGIGSSYFTRYFAAAIASGTCLKSIKTIGVGWTSTISAVVLWVGLTGTLVLIYWGEGMREKALVRYGFREGEDEKEKEKEEEENKEKTSSN